MCLGQEGWRLIEIDKQGVGLQDSTPFMQIARHASCSLRGLATTVFWAG